MSDYMPQEVLINIFTRLPIKSIVCFRCVCSSWNSLIVSSDFIDYHFLQTVTSNNQLVVTRHFSNRPKTEYYSFRLDNRTMDEQFKVEFPLKSSSADFKVVGSVRGLLCVVEDYIYYTLNLFLWNPSIRRCIKLPDPSLSLKTCAPSQVILGFGFDSRTNDYKIIRIVNVRKENRNSNVSMRAEVYSVNSGCWKNINTSYVSFYGIRHYQTSQANVNGILHWLAWNASDKNTVLSFDLGDETFREIDLPACLLHWWLKRDMGISVLGDTIAVFENNLDAKLFHVWVMKEYGLVDSWTKQFSIQLSGWPERPFDIRNNGEVLFSRIRERDVFSYDVETEEIRYLQIFTDYDSFFYSNSYVQSLVLLNKTNHLPRINKASRKRKYRK